MEIENEEYVDAYREADEIARKLNNEVGIEYEYLEKYKFEIFKKLIRDIPLRLKKGNTRQIKLK